MEIKYEKQTNTFIVISRYEEKDILKSAKFHWNPERRHWESNSIFNVKNVKEYLNQEALEIYNQKWKVYEGKIEASRAVSSIPNLDIPVPTNKTYMPFQKAGIEYLIKNQNILLGDEMGLGKTIQIVGYLNYAQPQKVLIVMPLSVKRNWYTELKNWLVYEPTIEIVNGKTPTFLSNITLIHYDSLKKYKDELAKIEFDVIIMDEAHYIKNGKAQRTKISLNLHGKKRILLTGTPILNRPNELFTLLKFLRNSIINNPKTGYPSYSYFVYRYCYVQEYMGHVNVVGGRNLEELQTKLRGSCMIRRLKKDVLTELPNKRRQMLPVKLEDRELLKESEKLMEKIKLQAGDWESVMKWLNSNPAMFEEMARVRHQLGVAKVPYAISFIEDALENEDKIVVFAHHRDVVEAIVNHFPNSAKLYGGMSANEREANIKKFNEDSTCRVFVGSIEASGLGINLQHASSMAFFIEMDWRPAYNVQAEDRIHRIGQKESVMIYNMVFDDTLDGYIISKLISKQKDITKALDEPVKIETDPDFEELKKAVQEEMQKKDAIRMEREENLKLYKVPEILEALRIISGNDPDHASIQNGIGFNGGDSFFGHILAEKTTLTLKQVEIAYRLLRKYKRQIPGYLYATIYEQEVEA